MGCSPSILSSLSNNHNRKDSGLYCSNNSDTNSNKIDVHNDTNIAIANQILVQSSTKDALEKVCWWHFLVIYAGLVFVVIFFDIFWGLYSFMDLCTYSMCKFHLQKCIYRSIFGWHSLVYRDVDRVARYFQQTFLDCQKFAKCSLRTQILSHQLNTRGNITVSENCENFSHTVPEE